MFQQPFYPPQQSFSNVRASTNSFVPPRNFFYRAPGPVINQSAHNLSFSHDFERFSMPHHGFTSIPSNRYPTFDLPQQHFDQQRWRQNMAQTQKQHRRTPAFHFQDKSTSYFMTEPIITSDDRITIQLTKVHIGPNGDQQRVFVEQEFSNEQELNKFVRNLRYNFEKAFNNRPSDQNSNTDESNSTNSKKSGVVVVEEPDEEPKVYQQQAYNENIESRKAAASLITPPMSPTMESASSPRIEDHSRGSSHPRRDTRQTSPSTSHKSSSSVARSNRRHKNKMKYRRQKKENREEPKLSQGFGMPSFSRQYQSTPVPPHFQQRFFVRDSDFRMKNTFNMPPNANFQWRYNPNSYPKTRSRSYVPSMNDHFGTPPATSSRFPNATDPFFQSMHPSKFANHPHPQHHHNHHPHHHQKDTRLPPSPTKLHRAQRRKSNHPTIIAESLVYPNNEQQQPRVQRTKSACRNPQKQRQQQQQQQQQQQEQQHHRSRSTTNHFQNFAPLQQPPLIQRNFTPFRSPPVILSSVQSTAPMFYPNHRRPFGQMQTQFRLMNPFHLSTNRF